MNIDNKFVVMQSGTSNWEFTGSQTVNVSLLCGISGTAIIPIQVTGDGRLFAVSGA